VQQATPGQALILDYVRTPRGKASAKGSLSDRSATDLLVHLQGALAVRTGLDTGLVGDVVVGCASQVDEQGANIARTSAILAGWGDEVPGVTLNRFCASGIDAVAQTAARLRSGDLDLAVAGGVESVSRVPMFADRGPLWADPATVRTVGSVHMGVAADLNATIEGFRRDDLDRYGVETQDKAAAAWSTGVFSRSVVAVPASESGPGLAQDELVRPGTTLEGLAALPPAFAQLGAEGQDEIALNAFNGVPAIEHLHTLGTSPQMADAAALLLLGTAESAEAAAGQRAVEEVIARAGLRPADIEVFEFAEAFSALCLRFRRDLDAGPERMNPNGGTMAMGHAFGATGAILVGSCLEELERRDGRYGVAAVSGAAGLGVAVLLERIAR